MGLLTRDERRALIDLLLKLPNIGDESVRYFLLADLPNDLRNQIGTYCMILVREVYLGQDIQVWNLLNARIAAAGLGQKGGGLWDRVNVRMKETNEPQEE